jgi:hypothetical protein
MGVPASSDPGGDIKMAAGAGVNGEGSASFLFGVLGVMDGLVSSFGAAEAFLEGFLVGLVSRGAVVKDAGGASTGA